MATRQTIIHRDELQGIRPLIWRGQEVYSKYEQIVSVVGARLGEEVAQLFSRPVVPDHHDVRTGQPEITWLADHVSSPRPLPELPDSEREACTARLGQLLEQVTALGEALKKADKPDERELGEVLQLAVEVPGFDYVLVERGRMVLVCWGFHAIEADERERFRLIKALERPAAEEEGAGESPEPSRTAPPQAPPPPRTEPPTGSGGWRRWRWIAAILGGLLLLVLLGVLLFWWLRPELVPPEPGFQPADPDRFVDYDDEPLGRQIVDGQLLVLLEEGVDTREILEQYARAWQDEGIRIAGYRPTVGLVQVEVDGELAAAKAYLQGLPEVEEATLNPVDEMEQYEPNDPGFDTEAEGGGARDWGYHAINAFEAWEVTLGSEDIKVAVIDGDFDPEHPEVAGPRVSGFNVTTGETNLEPEAGHSHGIHVAATAIGAIDNNEGVAGVCPRCSGLLIEASSGTQGMFAQTNIIDAMELARDRGADVINMSLGVIVPPDVDPDRVVRATRASERIYQRLIATMEEEGTVVVAAAGNDAVPARVDPRNRQDDSFVVGAVEHALAPASFTNYGDVVDIAAPGKAIYSAVAGGGYEKEEGTSMASPFVAGAVGLVRSVNPDLSPAEIRALLVDTAQPLEEDPDRPVGQLLDVAAAVEAAKPDDGVEPPGECDCPELERRVEELERRLEALEECCNGEPGDDDRLIIPGDPDEDDLTFAEGVWRASEGLTRDRDGVEIEIEFRISADGSGRIAYDEPEGECRADLTVTLEDRVLSMEHDEVATCQHDPATAYNPHQFECEALADGVAWCSAQSVVDPDRDVVRFFMEEQ